MKIERALTNRHFDMNTTSFSPALVYYETDVYSPPSFMSFTTTGTVYKHIYMHVGGSNRVKEKYSA